MNKQSNSYTIIYVILLVVIVGLGLSLVYQALHPMQVKNMDDDKKRQILAAALIFPDAQTDISHLYDQHITESFCVNYKGERINEADAFSTDIAIQSKEPDNKRILPVFICKVQDDKQVYILPAYGAGLWGPIWGYIAVESDGDTVYGAYFAHQGETPGLGAEIEKPFFSDQFKGKKLFTDGEFSSVAVVKAGHAPASGAYVDAISGATITSQGVGTMLLNSLAPYSTFLLNLQNTDKK